VFTAGVIPSSRPRSQPHRALGALTTLGVLGLLLTACVVAPEDAALAPSGSAADVVPAPGRTIEATPPSIDLELRGSRLAVVVPDGSAQTQQLRAAVRSFALEHDAVLEEFAATARGDDVEEAFANAVAADPDVVIGVGEAAVDVFAYETAQWLDQQFVLLGAQLPEPTANVTAVIWEGATSRGSGAPADGALDVASVTAARSAEAIAVGLGSVRDGTTGVVLHLGD